MILRTMRKEVLWLFAMLMLAGLPVLAQEVDDADRAPDALQLPAQDVPGADSLALVAQSPDFVRASLLVITPGQEPYSSWGHAALRLECPSEGLDYCFTFETVLSSFGKLLTLVHYPKAGFAAVTVDEYLSQYRAEGRGVRSYELNLLPTEEQALWRNLDEELARGAAWKIDVSPHNCATMVAWVLQKSLSSGTITYHALPTPLTEGRNRDVVDFCSEASPWCGLVLKLRLGLKGWDDASAERMMLPVLMGDAWQHATIDDGNGHSRSLVVGEPRWLVRAVWEPDPPAVTPRVAGLLLLFLLVLGLTLLYYRRRHSRPKDV